MAMTIARTAGLEQILGDRIGFVGLECLFIRLQIVFVYTSAISITLCKSLENIAPMLERWYKIKVEFENDEFRKYRFTGSYENEKLEHIIDSPAFN